MKTWSSKRHSGKRLSNCSQTPCQLATTFTDRRVSLFDCSSPAAGGVDPSPLVSISVNVNPGLTSRGSQPGLPWSPLATRPLPKISFTHTPISQHSFEIDGSDRRTKCGRKPAEKIWAYREAPAQTAVRATQVFDSNAFGIKTKRRRMSLRAAPRPPISQPPITQCTHKGRSGCRAFHNQPVNIFLHLLFRSLEQINFCPVVITYP